ncbi:MAG: alpha/beta fold hydrolase [Amnibacterium sp.]
MLRVVDGRPVFVMDVGTGGRPVLLHSGWIGTWEDWAPQVAALSRQNRVVAFDHRGAGRTPGEPSELVLDRLVDDLLVLADALELDRPVLGGFSTGSQVVQHALHRAPDRFSALILMSPCGDTPPDPAFLGLLEQDFAAGVEAFLDACLPEAESDDVSAVRKWARDILHQSGSAAAVALLRSMLAPSPALAGPALPDVPVLIVHGDRDPFSPVAYGRALAERFPRASHRVVPGAGHLVAMTRPGETADLMCEFVSTYSRN